MSRGNIRQRSRVRKDSWTVQVFLGVDPETGKKRYHSEAVRGSKADAERRLTELQRELDIGAFSPPPSWTVGQYFELWLRDHVEPRVRTRTFEGYRGITHRHIIPKLGKIPLGKLTARHVQELESALLREGGSKAKGLSARTVLHVHRVISGALKNAVRLGMINRNVAEAVELPRIARHEVYTLARDEVHWFLQQIEDPIYRTLVLLAIQTGLRRSELLGLNWRDIDFTVGTLAVQRALVKLESRGTELVPPKSGQVRVVELTDESVEALRAHRGRSAAEGEFVFCQSDGSPLRPDRVTNAFRGWCGMRGCPN